MFSFLIVPSRSTIVATRMWKRRGIVDWPFNDLPGGTRCPPRGLRGTRSPPLGTSPGHCRRGLLQLHPSSPCASRRPKQGLPKDNVPLAGLSGCDNGSANRAKGELPLSPRTKPSPVVSGGPYPFECSPPMGHSLWTSMVENVVSPARTRLKYRKVETRAKKRDCAAQSQWSVCAPQHQSAGFPSRDSPTA